MRSANRTAWPAVIITLGIGVMVAGLALLGLRSLITDTKASLDARISQNKTALDLQKRQIASLQAMLTLTREQLAAERAHRAEQDRLILALQEQVRDLGGDPITTPPPEPSPTKTAKPKPSKSPKPRPTKSPRPSKTPCPVPLPVCPVIRP